jgi:chromosome segregation ATPase
MPSTLRQLIDAGGVSGDCLRCRAKLEDRDCTAGRRVLGDLKAQDVHKNPNYQYQIAVWALAKCSFCRSCAKNFLQEVKDYFQELRKCLAKEFGVANEATPVSGSGEIKTELQKRKDRRTCPPAELEELAKQMKQLERESDGFKKRISVLKQELQTERSQREKLQCKHQKLQHLHTEMIDIGTKQYAKAIAEGTTIIAELTQQNAKLTQRNADLFAEGTTRIADLNKQNTDLTAEANAKFVELMQKIAGLESQNLWIQEQMQNQQTMDKTDIAKMASTIKELNAGLRYCHGERYKIWLTPTSQIVVNTLEPM